MNYLKKNKFIREEIGELILAENFNAIIQMMKVITIVNLEN
jgi:hypothetical protein